jgi:hypothetical protein
MIFKSRSQFAAGSFRDGELAGGYAVTSAVLILKLQQSWQTAESYELTVCARQNGLTHTVALSPVQVRNISI